MTSIRVLEGDNLAVMTELAVYGARYQLVYADIPFCSNRVYTTSKGSFARDGEVAFDDRWDSLEAYLEATTRSLMKAWTLLTPDGSLVVHVDTTASHYVKVELDRAFGRSHFASEIIWRYRRWPTKTSNFQRVHDTLFRYRRDITVMPRFNQLYEPLSPKTIATWGTRKQRAVWDPETGKGVKDSPPRRLKSSTTAEQSPGVPLGDVWDIGIVAPVSRERTGYPTQKPLALLERLILATTNEGDRVLDPFCGSATTLMACKKLRRHAVGIDSSKVAVRIARERLGLVTSTSAAVSP